MSYTRTWRQVFGRRRPGRKIGKVSEAIAHTEAGAPLPASASVDQEVRRLEGIDAYHRSLGWQGFGYSAMPCQSGRVYEGRGFFRSGAHTKGRNTKALAYVLPGNGDRTAMSDAAIDAAASWLREGVEAGALTEDFTLSGHRDYSSKSCPGDKVYPQLPEVRERVSGSTPILGEPQATVAQAQAWARARGGTSTFLVLAPKYWRLASRNGVRPDVAYAQAAKETGFGRFGGVVDASYFNPCGMKTRDGGGNSDPSAHQRFGSWEEGIAAHLDHLALYAGAPGTPRENTPDPRHFSSIHGTAKTVESLGGKWAPAPDYGRSIVEYLSGFADTSTKEWDQMATKEEIGDVVDERLRAAFGHPKGWVRGNGPTTVAHGMSILAELLPRTRKIHRAVTETLPEMVQRHAEESGVPTVQAQQIADAVRRQLAEALKDEDDVS